MDVKAAFLYGNLESPVYMYQPDGFDDGSGKVCKLSKSIYGLRQASRCWFKRLDNFLRSIGFNGCQTEACLYYSFSKGAVTFILLYVDDLILTSTSIQVLQSV